LFITILGQGNFPAFSAHLDLENLCLLAIWLRKSQALQPHRGADARVSVSSLRESQLEVVDVYPTSEAELITSCVLTPADDTAVAKAAKNPR
jgi:hypothetical protein